MSWDPLSSVITRQFRTFFFHKKRGSSEFDSITERITIHLHTCSENGHDQDPAGGEKCFECWDAMLSSFFQLHHFATLVLRENIPGMVGGSFPFLLSMVLSLNYFPVVVHALSELNLLTSDLSQLAISCAILHKTIGWLTVALTSAIIKSDKGVFMKTELSILALFSVTIFVL